MKAKNIAFSRHQIYIVAAFALLSGAAFVFSSYAGAQDLFSPSATEGSSSKAMASRLDRLEMRLDELSERTSSMPAFPGIPGIPGAGGGPASEAEMQDQLNQLLKGGATPAGGMGLIDEEPDASGRKVVGIINGVKIFEKNSKMGAE